MISIPAKEILKAIEAGEIESILDDGFIVVMIDLEPVFEIPALEEPQIRVGLDHAVTIECHREPTHRIECKSAEDAEIIADAIARLIELAA